MDIKQVRCDDCRHTIRNHDYLGCVLMGCRCRLSSLFLIEYHQEEPEPPAGGSAPE